MKNKYFFVLVFLTSTLLAQKNKASFYFNFGAGILKSSKVAAPSFENEISVKMSKYFSSGLVVAYGRGNNGTYKTSSFFQGNMNLYFVPFGNYRKNNLKLGTGISIINITNAIEVPGICTPPVTDNYFKNLTAAGYNFILEDTHFISEKHFIGIKLFYQSYPNIKESGWGVFLKWGVRI